MAFESLPQGLILGNPDRNTQGNHLETGVIRGACVNTNALRQRGRTRTCGPPSLSKKAHREVCLNVIPDTQSLWSNSSGVHTSPQKGRVPLAPPGRKSVAEETNRLCRPPVTATLLLDGFYSHSRAQPTTTHISRELLLPSLPLPPAPTVPWTSTVLAPTATVFVIVPLCSLHWAEFSGDRHCVLSLFSPSKWNTGPGIEPVLKKQCLHE